MTTKIEWVRNPDGSRGSYRVCLLCSASAAHDCDEMICGYICQRHLDEWSPDGGPVQEAWEKYCKVREP